VVFMAGTLRGFHSTWAGRLILSTSRSTGWVAFLTWFRMERRRDVARRREAGFVGISSREERVFSTVQ